MSNINIFEKYKLEHLDIEITRECNLDCYHCSAGIERIGYNITQNDIKSILSEAKSLGLNKVGFTGGETLLHFQDLQDLTFFSKQKLGLDVHIHSNGCLITPEIAQWVSKSNVDMTVTVLGHTEKCHDAITNVNGSLKLTMTGLQHLLNEKATISIFIVPMKENIKEIPSLIMLLHDMGCEDIRILSFSPTGKALSNFLKYVPSQKEIDQLNEEFYKIQNELDITLNAGFCTRFNHPNLNIRKGHNYCYAAQNRVHIDGFGNVFPCTAASGRLVFSAGNVMLSETSLTEIWRHSPLFNYIRKYHENPDTKCLRCDRYKECMGGCRVMMAYYHNDFSISNPDCGGPFTN